MTSAGTSRTIVREASPLPSIHAASRRVPSRRPPRRSALASERATSRIPSSRRSARGPRDAVVAVVAVVRFVEGGPRVVRARTILASSTVRGLLRL